MVTSFQITHLQKKAVDKGLNNVNISLKYTDVDNYRLLSDNSDINNIINGHNNLRSLGCSVTMSYVILNQTIEDINKLKKFLIQNSINKIFFNYINRLLETNK